MKMNNNDAGFSLVELLVVVIIIAIVAAIAIPSLLSSRRAANDASAISSLRTIHSAEISYYAVNGQQYSSLGILSAGLFLDPIFGNSPIIKSGFRIAGSVSTTDTPISQFYCASAVPVTVGTTGNKGYAISQVGVIYKYDTPANASAACAAGVLTPGTGVPLD